MLIARVDQEFADPCMALGSTDWIPHDLELGDAPAVSTDTHVMVRVEAQTALIRMRLFRDDGTGPEWDPSFIPVSEGLLHLADGRLVIGDTLGESRFVRYVGGPWWQVRVSVDDPDGYACAVDVVLRRQDQATLPIHRS